VRRLFRISMTSTAQTGILYDTVWGFIFLYTTQYGVSYFCMVEGRIRGRFEEDSSATERDASSRDESSRVEETLG
jgi:hypothetical protein